MRESKIEKHLRKEVKALGGWMQKMTSPGVRGCPDNLVMWPFCGIGSPQVARLVNSGFGTPAIEFIETKAPKKGPTVLQQKDHERRRKMGFQVHVIGSMEAAETYLKSRGKK